MKKSELKTIHYLLKNHSNSLLKKLDKYIENKQLSDNDDVAFDDDNSISDDFLEILIAAEKFHRTSGIELKLFKDIDDTNNALNECAKKCETLDLQLEAATLDVALLRKQLDVL